MLILFYPFTKKIFIKKANLYINIEDKETVSDRPTIGFKRGCGCILNKRVDRYYNHCIVGKAYRNIRKED